MNIYDNNKELLAALGITGEFSTDFEVRKAILTALGGDASNVNSIYEADIKILDIYKNGGGAGGGDCSELEAQIQALEAEVAALEAENSTLETENNTLEASNTQLESQIASIGTLSVTENGTYTPEAGILGWNNVEVNVAGGGGGKIVLGNNIKLGYSSFREVPDYFDFSQTTNFDNMFHSNKITTIPQIDTSNVTSFSFMFYNCRKLATIPQMNTSNGTDFSHMFRDCSYITSVPQLDTSNGTDFSYIFHNCRNLTSIPPLDTSKATNVINMFTGCNTLKVIEGVLDFSNITIYLTDMFGTDFAPLRSLEEVRFKGKLDCNTLGFYCPALSYDSIKSILTACANKTRTNATTLIFDKTIADNNGELSDLIAQCNAKNWTISGLTLN